MKKRMKLLCLVLACILALTALSGCGKKGGTVVVASKQFTENYILSEMYAQLIEAHTDLKVERKQYLGGTSVCFPAMEEGQIDIYVEYSGTAYGEILKLGGSGGIPSDTVYDTVKSGLGDMGITMFEPIGINNTYAIGLLKSKAEELGVTSMSDIIALSADMKFGANHLFYTRESDGYDSMIDTYGYSFAAAERMDSSLLYEAIAAGQLDVIVIYATDSLLVKYDMTILEDDQELFPAYHGAPICRNEVLEAHPELGDVLNKLAGLIDDETMQQLDYEVDVEQKEIADVAKAFLTDKGLL